MKSSSVSECCNAPVSVRGNIAKYYVCGACHRSTDLAVKPKFSTDFWYGKVKGSDHVRSTTKMIDMDEAYLSVTNDLPNRGEE